MKQVMLAFFTIALAWGPAAPARAADAVLGLVPKDAEVVVGVNTRQIFDSSLFTKLKGLVPQIGAGAAVIENLTGVSVLQDIDRVVLFGNIADRDTGGALVAGRVKTDKLLTLLQSAPGYKTSQADGRTVHEWQDPHEKRMKYGIFFENGILAVWNSQAAMAASLAVLKDPAGSFGASPDARLIPGDSEKTAAWLVLVNRLNTGPAAKYRIASILGAETLGATDLTVSLTVIPQDAADTAKWVDMGRGLVAFGLLQGDAIVNYLASHSKVDAGGDGKAAIWMTTVENEKLLGTLAPAGQPK